MGENRERARVLRHQGSEPGPSPRPGQTCVMHYTGWLWQDNAKGKKFDSSVDRESRFRFPSAQGE